jgi:predicted nucleic acid-binding protein
VRFVDTNVLLYAISRDPAEQDKAKHANDILAERDLAPSEQVLQEFYVQATRASRPDAIGHRQAVLLIQSFRRFPIQDLTSGIMMAALDARQRFQLSYWDAAIIEASRAMGCTHVLPRASATARTTAASGSPTRSAKPGYDGSKTGPGT